MARIPVTNSGDFTGEIGGETGVVAATNVVETNLITGITATKSVDKEFWISGPLAYTIVITNESGEDYENVVLTDTLHALIELDEDYGVFVRGVSTTNYTYVGKLLTVPIGNVANGDSVTVLFHVLQA